jgi:hypothetical protein
MPRVCSGCGGKLSMRRDSLWLDTFRRESWHAACKLEQLRGRADRSGGR